ncbi:unnamed protein product [Blepharisma stoltei]|uniref:Uncharacterized protein n=1 Tax=Blepharisma stoltei TaxID=1481888 RepID=A0AAU9KD63_9CILI|nr:unnamed protein product [Blepharisma stoltei]
MLKCCYSSILEILKSNLKNYSVGNILMHLNLAKIGESVKYSMKDSNQKANIFLGFKNGIIEFDPYNGKQKRHNLDWGLIRFRWIIDLHNGELLCCGEKSIRRKIGYSKPRKATVLFIINNKTFRVIREIPYRYYEHDWQGVYYNNAVYLFGNYTSTSFNLAKGKWKKLAPLPMNSSECYCIPFKRSILLCGTEHSDVYKYDIDIKSYSTLGLSLDTYNAKLLLFHSKIAYLIELKGYIYESEEENEYSWTQVGLGSIYGPAWQLYWASNNSSIFIGTYSKDDTSNYYEFQLSQKKLIQICLDSEKNLN